MPATRIWTIGHSTRTFEEFLALLRLNDIGKLADIRTIPQSRRHPHFSQLALAAQLKDQGIEYQHFPELGGLRKPQPESPNTAWKNLAFRGYSDHMLKSEFAAGLDRLVDFGQSRHAAVMCAEAVWWRCHRMLLSDALLARGVDVQHILSAANTQPHRLTPFARLDSEGGVSYPGLL
jgi:uncharacterized protein (DUF488 family)